MAFIYLYKEEPSLKVFFLFVILNCVKNETKVQNKTAFLHISLTFKFGFIFTHWEKDTFKNLIQAKDKADQDPYYHTKISIYSFTWADLAAFHKSDKI